MAFPSRPAPTAALAAVVVVGLALGAVPAGADPIAPGPATSLPTATGGPVRTQPVRATRVPQNPGLARNPRSNIHDDTWMTDSYPFSGPLGRASVLGSGAMPPAVCGSLAFDRRGRIVSVCPSAGAAPQARIIDPATLRILASFDLPQAPDAPGTKTFQNFTGGGYFFLDPRDRIWSASKTSHLLVIAEGAGGTSLQKVADYDLTGVLNPDERVTSALPDFRGRVWFVSKRNGKVGVLDPRTRRIRVKRLGEEVENSFAVDRDAVYIVSDRRMYRMSAGRRGRPRIDWSVRYRNSGIVKPSQVNAGSGTTPTIMAGGYVAITDNADPMNVVVYRRATHLRRGARRVVCQVPVFPRGASATENSLLTAGRTLVVENNYGYQDPFGPMTGALTEPGFARVDVRRGGRGCRKVWESSTERAPSVVPKLSAKAGLVYTYTRDEDPNGTQPWFWTAISLRTGKTAFKRYAGSGLSFNNNYAGIGIARDGSAYLGVIGGVVSLRDG
jgi:hypothetical protein